MTSFYYLQCIAQQCTQNSLRLRLLWFPNRQICYWLPWSLFSVLGENLSFEAGIVTHPRTHTHTHTHTSESKTVLPSFIQQMLILVKFLIRHRLFKENPSQYIPQVNEGCRIIMQLVGCFFYVYLLDLLSTLFEFVCYVRCPWRLNSRRIWRKNHLLVADAVRKNKT